MLHIPFDCLDVHLGVRLQIITFHMSLFNAHLIPGGFRPTAFSAFGKELFFFHTALFVCARRAHERRPCATEDVMPHSNPSRGLYQLTY